MGVAVAAATPPMQFTTLWYGVFVYCSLVFYLTDDMMVDLGCFLKIGNDPNRPANIHGSVFLNNCALVGQHINKSLGLVVGPQMIFVGDAWPIAQINRSGILVYQPLGVGTDIPQHPSWPH